MKDLRLVITLVITNTVLEKIFTTWLKTKPNFNVNGTPNTRKALDRV